MKNFDEKLNFLRNDFIFLLRHLPPSERGSWGLMNGQQMVEHFTETVLNSSGKLVIPQLYEGEKLERIREFLMSEKPFRPNTKSPVLPEEPGEIRHSTMQEAITELQLELEEMVQRFQHNPEMKIVNPVFGELNFEGVVQFLHKHAIHHLTQFGLYEVEGATPSNIR